MSFTQYTVTAPKRWDQIAYEAYGDATKVSVILEANPTIRILPVLEAGTVLYLPILERPQVDKNLLPPWKR